MNPSSMTAKGGWSTAIARAERVRQWWSGFFSSRPGRLVGNLARGAFLVAIVGYLAWALAEVGWSEVLSNLPTQPAFYALFLALYFLLPVSEVFMYRLTWDYPLLRSFPAFLKKRVYNREIVGYSGEVYFFSWARRRIGGPESHLLETIRDNNILSSISSNLVIVVLLAVFLLAGEVRLSELVGDGLGWTLILVAVATAALVPIAVRYRKYLFSMPARIAWTILALQCLRLLVGQVLQIGQWAVVMPEVPLRIWFTFAAVSLVLTRIPFLPNQGLVFMGAGIELSQAIDISTASIAGMLLVTSVLDKALNLVLFGAASVLEREPGPAASDRSGPREANAPDAV